MAVTLRHFSCFGSRLVVRRPCVLAAALQASRTVASQPPNPPAPRQPTPPAPGTSPAEGQGGAKIYRERLLDGGEEILTEAEKQEKDEIIKDLTRRLSGPLADEHGNVPTGEDRPIAIEVDGPSHFYANSKRYTAYTKLKHRLLIRMGYKVLHVPYFEWRRLRGAKEREEYMRAKLQEEPTEWLDPEDEKYYSQPPDEDDEEFSVKPEPPATPPAPPASAAAEARDAASAREARESSARGPPPTPPPPPGVKHGSVSARKGQGPPPLPPTPPPPPRQSGAASSGPAPPIPPTPPPSPPRAASGGQGQSDVPSFPPFPPPPRK
eukprot:TRINITY_DN43183_c0_g1_i1.p1 TRINITY_DN43183_c0_g1~~TRINITY_DN43183_c0_g1_i1.p1  ORF type:complete len:322 (-),score=65.93 TRINITY_DN43183_c0_g1_i1:21-986(-)